jgi:hypothetical protein
MARVKLLFSLLSLSLMPLSADTVGWYNGDLNASTALSNEINTAVSDSRVYEDFIVPAGGWTVTGLFTNNLMDFSTSQALWEIRSGVSVGNGGSLIAFGTGAATQTATGRNAFGFAESTIEVDGLNVALAQGTYWMTVAPIGPGGNTAVRSFLTTTSGLNAVGLPPGNDGNSFFDSTFYSANFASTPDLVSPEGDFSSGVIIAPAASAVPEPGALELLLGGGLLVFGIRRRSR